MKFKLLIIAFFIFISGCDEKKNDEKIQSWPVITQDYTKAFALNLYSGENLGLQKTDKGFEINNNDKAVLFVFFTTWCPPCKAEIPHLNDILDKYSENLRIIGVLLEHKTKAEIAKFIQKYDIKFEIALGENNFFFSKTIGEIEGIPFMLLYDAKGNFISKYAGLVAPEMIIVDINRIVL